MSNKAHLCHSVMSQRVVIEHNMCYIFSPFRDRPVRVGGGFAYMNNESEPEYMAAMKKIREEQDAEMAAMMKTKTGLRAGKGVK